MESNGGEQVLPLAAAEPAEAKAVSGVHVCAHRSCLWADKRLPPLSCAARPAAFPPPLSLHGACPQAHLPCPACPHQPCNPACLLPTEADWELVSSSSEEEGAGSELQREAEALAHSFQKGEPSPPCSGGGSSPPASAASGELGLARSAAGEPAPGSPQHLQRLQLLAAPLPAPAWPGPAPSGEGHPAETMHAGTAVGPAGSSPASPGASPAGHEASTSSSSAEDLHLRVVRSDDLHGLERAVAALEKR